MARKFYLVLLIFLSGVMSGRGTLEVVTESNYTSLVLSSEKPVVLFVTGSWTGPCFIQVPILEELKEEYGNKLSFLQINLDKSAALAKTLQIPTVPRLLFYYKGKKIQEFIGTQPKGPLKAAIVKFLNNAK